MKSLTMIRSITALLILTNAIPSSSPSSFDYKLSYSDLEALGGSCYPRDSCAPYRGNNEDHLWGKYTCECGKHCIQRKTCCIDSPHVGNKSVVEDRGITCQELPGFEDGVELISRCPDEMSAYAVRQKCERINENKEPFSLLPATSLDTKVTYKNFYCAVCNHDAKNISLWKIYLAFPSKESFSRVTNVTEVYTKVKISLIVPPNLQKIVKRCYPGMVSECLESPVNNSWYEGMCSSYYAPIKLKTNCGPSKIYRNIHCAICNSVKVAMTEGNICSLDRKPITPLCHQGLTYNFSYSELKDLGGSCHPGDSCRPSRNYNEDNLWGNYTCECGYHCIRRGTCCIDSIHVEKKYRGLKEDRGETCQKPPQFEDYVELISRCPEEMSAYAVREKCERNYENAEPFEMLPATSLETNRTYKNFYCAMCNRDRGIIVLWKIHGAFPSNESFSRVSSVTEEFFKENLVYSDAHKTWGVMKGNSFYGMKISFILPPYLQQRVKRCYPGMVSKCDPYYAGRYELLCKCSSYYAPIKVKNKCGLLTVYRNMHCATCNNVYVISSDEAVCESR